MDLNSYSKLKISKSNSGYTIIEVLIALAIFSIGFMAVGALQTSALMETGEISRKIEASTVLADQVERLKGMPFYKDHQDDDGDGNPYNQVVEECNEELLPKTGGHTVSAANGRYDVHWQVVNDAPIGQTIMPGANSGAAITVSKTITVSVTKSGGNPANDSLLSVEFIKVYSETM